MAGKANAAKKAAKKTTKKRAAAAESANGHKLDSKFAAYPPEAWALARAMYESESSPTIEQIRDAVEKEFGRRPDPKSIFHRATREHWDKTFRTEYADAEPLYNYADSKKAEIAVRLSDQILEVLEKMNGPYELVVMTPKDGEIRTTLDTPPADALAKMATTLAQLIDRLQLLTGGATSRNENLTPEQLEKKGFEVVDELRRRREAKRAATG